MAQDAFVKPTRALTWPDAASADWDLVQQCAAGDEQACTRLVTDHQRMVYQLALHLLADRQEALDLSQDVFLRVFRTLPQFRGHASLRTWIYRIVVTQASNRRRWWRRRKQAFQVCLEDHTAAHGDLPELRHSALPDCLLQQREAAGLVHQALERLPIDQRAAIVLREIEGLSYEEIGESLGISAGNVKTRLARARATLRAELRPS